MIQRWLESEPRLCELLVANTPLIDVRAPSEFARGSIPGSVNLPVLDDVERAAVGTMYKSQGQTAAIDLGRRLVSGELLESRLRAWTEFIRARPDSMVYCFRGGLRSQSVQSAVKEAGYDVPVIEGGYKRVRRFLINANNLIGANAEFAVISGYTGAGKTEFLASLASEFRSCDLERAASHRGSTFGKLKIPQPSQADFENRIAVGLLKVITNQQKRRPILIEDESRKIGRLDLPPAIYAAVSRSKVYVLDRSLQDRSRYLVDLYLRENYGIQDGDADPEKLQTLRRDLHRDLHGLSRRLGGLELKEMLTMVDSAITEHLKTGLIETHREWVERLLVRYYDPYYGKHLKQIESRVAFRGSAEEVRDKLLSDFNSAV